MAQPTTQDLLAPFDPTGYVNISGAQLLQLITGASPNTDIGMIVLTVDVAGVPQVPNAVNTIKWESYMWLRVSTNFVTAYVWNPGGATDATYLNWVTLSSAAIGPGTIQGYMIATATIPATAIISIQSSQITGSVVPAWLAQLNAGSTGYATNGLMNSNSLIFGAMNGVGSTVANPIFGAAVVTLANMAKQSVAGNPVALQGNIVDNSITTLQLLNNGLTSSPAFALNGAVDPAFNIATPTKSLIGIPSSTNFNTATSGSNILPGDILAVNWNAAGVGGYVPIRRAILTLLEPTAQATTQLVGVVATQTTYSLINPQGANGGLPFGRVLQVSQGLDAGKYSSAGNVTLGTVSLEYGATGMTPIAGLQTTFTPLNAGSRLLIEVVLNIHLNASSGVYGLYTSNTSLAEPLSMMLISTTSAGAMLQLIYQASIAPGAVTPITFYSEFGCNANSAFINSVDGATTILGGISSSIKITEYI